MQPRYYQSAANDAAWSYLAEQPGNPLIVLPTGAGKSLVIAMLCRQAIEFGGRVVVLQHRKELIIQNTEKIQILIPDIKIGIYSAGLKSREVQEDIVCAGIQSIYRKSLMLGRRELILIDEAHLVSSDDETMYGQFLTDIRIGNPTQRVVGLTATPYRTSEGPMCGRNKLFQRICYEAFTGDLISEGYLCQITNKPAEGMVDTSLIKQRGGEFIEREMQNAFDTSDNVTAACAEIVVKCHDRKSVLVFSSGVAHAEHVAETLRTLTGETVAVITGETFPLERSATLSDFKRGQLRWLVNCDVLCLDEQTEILTSAGWTSIDEMTADHLVASWDFDSSIRFEKPSLIVRRRRGAAEKMCVLKSNAIDIRVTDNHRMIKWQGSDETGKWVVVPAATLVEKAVKLPCHGTAIPFDIKATQEDCSKKKRQARIRSLSFVYRKSYGMSHADSIAAATLHADNKDSMLFRDPCDLTIDECRFIGFWVGDGTKHGGRVTVSQSMAYGDNIKWFEDVLNRCGLHFTKSINKPASNTKHSSVRWCLSKGTGGIGQKVSGGYYRLIPYLEKDGTELLFGFSKEQFEAFLEGWWKADGLHHASEKQNLNRVSCSNKKLIDRIQAVATCRGIRTSIRICSAPRKENHSQQYTLSWCNAKRINVRKNRFAYDDSPRLHGERVWCVTSCTGNIVTRRNGKVSVVGNTTGFDAPCIDAICVLRATMSPGLFAQIVGRGLRKHESKDNCLVLDFGENIKRHGSLDDRNYGRASVASGMSRGEPAENNGRGKECPNCGLDVAARSAECEDCGFIFPVKHETTADHDSAITGQTPPETWKVHRVTWARHTKRNADGPPTLRVDYDCSRDEGDMKQTISEWVCLEHEGYARTKAGLWWQARSIADCPETVSEATHLMDRGCCRNPATITTDKEGRWYRIKSVEFDTDKPAEWAEEDEPVEVLSEFTGVDNDVPF